MHGRFRAKEESARGREVRWDLRLMSISSRWECEKERVRIRRIDAGEPAGAVFLQTDGVSRVMNGTELRGGAAGEMQL